MKVKLIDIFWLFVKIGSCMFGGGIVILPLLEREAVEKRGWLTTDELVEFYAISQLIPGINAPDVSMFIGYKLRGKSGALAAGMGVILVPFILIVSLAVVLGKLSGFAIVKSALWGVGIGTIVILSSALRSMWKSSIIDKATLIFALFVFLLIAFTNISPVWIVFVALIIGVTRGILIKKEEEIE